MDRRGTLALALMLGCATLGIGVAPGAAATFTVDTTADVADPNPGDGACGSGKGSCSLRAAIQECNKSSVSSAIEVPAGTYRLTVTGPNEAFAATGDLDLVGTTTIDGAGADQTIVDGDGIDRVFDVSENAIVAIKDLTVKGGVADGGNGGGILNLGRLKLENVTVAGNRAKGDPLNQNGAGGGIASRTHLSMMNVRIAANVADGDGGGLQNKGFAELMNGAVTGNGSLTQNGGGIANDGKLSIAISTVDGNRAANGGGIDNVGGELRVADSTVSGNNASASGGGIRSSGPLTVVNATISGNTAGGAGGGLANRDRGTVDLNDATIAGNTTTGGDGGGIASDQPRSIALANTIVAGNTASGGNAADCAATVATRGHNLVQSVGGCSLAGDAAGDLVGQDPKLGPLADNGGSTKTRALLAGSPAIDAGNPARPTGDGGACAVADQRGVKRPQGRACDIGAFELEAQKSSSRTSPGGAAAAGG
ncbi:MAG TPA: choice-of-anchor Q domain-containing protein [Candidatus Binatia bacterium]|nr:choice-of-anchor Q domain-containing protein [Candidatus Binatia bacterium]